TRHRDAVSFRPRLFSGRGGLRQRPALPPAGETAQSPAVAGGGRTARGAGGGAGAGGPAAGDVLHPFRSLRGRARRAVAGSGRSGPRRRGPRGAGRRSERWSGSTRGEGTFGGRAPARGLPGRADFSF